VGLRRPAAAHRRLLRQGSAKAHALAALLPAEDIPTALCRQRDEGGGRAVHGLVAVRSNGAWYRQDPRGNKPGVDARFSLAGERLAFVPDPKSNEMDYPVLYAEPHPIVLAALKAAPDRSRLRKPLPDAL
jgi:transglutaminase-like putative cysteine protease